MKFDEMNYPVLMDVDDLENNTHHSILLYDDAEYGLVIKKRFIENGLKKGENVICFTPYAVNNLEKEIKSSGIDVNYYKQKGYLHFYQIEDITKREDGIKAGFSDMLELLTSNSSETFRVLGTAIPDVSNTERVQAQIEGEKLVHSKFDKKPFTFLCPYDISKIESKQRPLWIKELSANHHNLIYATKPEKAVTFDTDLLKTTEY